MWKFMLGAVFVCAAGNLWAVGKEDFRIELVATNVIKDLRNSTCNPDLGYAGDFEGGGTFEDGYLAYVCHPERTARIYREAGVWLVRPCGLFGRFRHLSEHAGKEYELDKNGKCSWLDPSVNFRFYRKYGLKAIVCLDSYRANDADALERFAQWIVENKWEDLVAGFEMCNEPFYGNDPVNYAENWKAFFPRIRKHLPSAKIGLPLAEYCDGDPDIEQVKARLLGEGKLGSDYFSANNLNRWSAKVVEALGEDLTNVTHLVYHVYGGNSSYGCSNNGFTRFRKFAKMFPQAADKRWWITEWRERSDENLQCHRMFRMTLWRGMYIQTALCQPELDGFTLHQLTSLSGAFYMNMHGAWSQYFDDWKNGEDVQSTGPDDLRYEVGCTGALYALYVQALKTHPIVSASWSMNHRTQQGVFWACSQYYDNPKKNVDCQWTALFSKSRTSLCLLIANTTDEELSVPVSVYGYRLGTKTYRYLTCESRYLDAREVPGEPKPWTRISWEESWDMNDPISPNCITIPPRSVGTVMIAMRERSDRWADYAANRIYNEIVRTNTGVGVDCCAVRKGKSYMRLPQKSKEGLSAAVFCEKIGKGGGFDANAIKEAREAGYEVFENAKEKAAFLLKFTGLPDSARWRARLAEIAGY